MCWLLGKVCTGQVGVSGGLRWRVGEASARFENRAAFIYASRARREARLSSPALAPVHGRSCVCAQLLLLPSSFLFTLSFFSILKSGERAVKAQGFAGHIGSHPACHVANRCGSSPLPRR